MKEYYVYIMSNQRGTLYAGITNDLEQRVYQHKNKLIEGFTKKYNVCNLVYMESFDNPEVAIKREKQLKKWNRNWKIKLIEKNNPDWKDLYNSILSLLV